MKEELSFLKRLLCLSFLSLSFLTRRKLPSKNRAPFNIFFIVLSVGKEVPKMDLIRKHLMIEGQIDKTCLVRILEEVTAVYSK